MKQRWQPWLALGLCAVPFWLIGPSQLQAQGDETVAKAAFAKAKPMLKKYCEGCHAGRSAAAGLDISLWTDLSAARKAKVQAEKALKFVRGKTMPPAGMPQPKANEKLAIERGLLAIADPAKLTTRPAVTVRRLNREEYDNTIQDLLGISFTPGRDFPNDDVGYGFDNIGDVLSISPLLMEKYFDAAEKASELAIVLPQDPRQKFEAAQLRTDTGRVAEQALVLFMNGYAAANAQIAVPGKYRVKVTAFAQQAGPDIAKMVVSVDGKAVGNVEVRGTDINPTVLELPVDLGKGNVTVSAAFMNDFYDPNHPDRSKRDRNLYIQLIEVVGPLGGPATMPASHGRIFVVQPDRANPKPGLTAIFQKFLLRAYRRPPTATEVDRVVALASSVISGGETVERGVQVGVQATLCSPHFLMRVEAKRTAGSPLNDYELASRLSYFLWSSMPDDTLLDLAAQKKLGQPKILREQTDRMLRSPKAKALTQNFAGQWLQLRKFEGMVPDPKIFPEFSPELKRDMKLETEAYFQNILATNASILEFVDSNYAFLNQRLADHYGITGVVGEGLRKVALPDRRRGGVLTQGSILTLTSNPNRTSPVKRGKYVLEQVLGAAPPPPPPGADSLEDGNLAVSVKSIKDRMERHRRNPNCAVCHTTMDTIGFAFENYDAVGQWRDKDGELAIDPSGQIPGEAAFQNGSDLRTYLMAKKLEFTIALTEKMLTYALGRGVTEYDQPTLDALSRSVAQNEYRMHGLIHGIVQSGVFRQY